MLTIDKAHLSTSYLNVLIKTLQYDRCKKIENFIFVIWIILDYFYYIYICVSFFVFIRYTNTNIIIAHNKINNTNAGIIIPSKTDDDELESDSDPDDDDWEEEEPPENADLTLSAKSVTTSESIPSPFTVDPNAKLDDDTNVIDDEGDPDGTMLVVMSDISGFLIVDDSDKLEVGCLVSGTVLGRIWLMDIESDIDILMLVLKLMLPPKLIIILPDTWPNISRMCNRLISWKLHKCKDKKFMSNKQIKHRKINFKVEMNERSCK